MSAWICRRCGVRLELWVDKANRATYWRHAPDGGDCGMPESVDDGVLWVGDERGGRK